MKTTGRLDVPIEFLDRYYGPKSRPEERRDFEQWVRTKRDALKRSPTFPGIADATKKAVEMYRKDKESLPSVWKEPRDMGTKFTVVNHENREDAYIGGYKETVDSQKIHDLSTGRRDGSRYDDIKEV